MSNNKELARRIYPLIDLTRLEDDVDNNTIIKLCERANSKYGNVASVCVYPRFIKTARNVLRGTPVKITTVVNFPHGTSTGDEISRSINEACADGADEIDTVMDYNSLRDGKHEIVWERLLAAREASKGLALKIILESSVLNSDQIWLASNIAIHIGADFIKTSTGKIPVGATPNAARTMLSAIRSFSKASESIQLAHWREPVGFKASGGIRDIETASKYLNIADEILGSSWVTPASFRFGASSLLGNVLEVLDQ
jgi:deoxyribose-phosphate aldolase